MKRLWPIPVLLLLALPLRAQDDASGPQETPDKQSGQDGDAPTGDAAAPNGDTPTPDPGPVAETNSSESQPAPDAAEGGEPAEKPVKEEPVISVKAVGPAVEEGDEESVAPAVAETKVVPTATIMKPAKKGRKKSAAKGAKLAKGKKAISAVVKTKAPVVVVDVAPPPPPVPAVPLTPITPRNP